MSGNKPVQTYRRLMFILIRTVPTSSTHRPLFFDEFWVRVGEVRKK